MTRTILLVEDSLTDEKLALRAFKKAAVPAEMIVARDGAEALELLFGLGARAGHRLTPSLVLLDLKLPRVDGLEVLRRVRSDERARLVPVVALTASREEQDIARCYALGANAYVRKPVDFTEFVEAARTISRFWLELNEPAPERALP